MIMRGDLNKIIESVNGVMETAFNRIDALEDRVKELEEVKRGRGRPPGSKNKVKNDLT